MLANSKEDDPMKEKDQNQGWKHFKGDTIGVVLSSENSKTTDRPENKEKQRKAPIKGTKRSLPQRIARKLVILMIMLIAVPIIAWLSIYWYSTSRDTPILLYANEYALYNGSVYTHERESIVLADDGKGFIELTSYLNLSNQGVVTIRALGTHRYFAFVWMPKPPDFKDAYGLIDYNCDRQYTPMIIGGALIIPSCFKKILADKMAAISYTSPKVKPDIES